MQDPAVLQGQNFVVTGHSLGGYLAAAVKSSYPQATQGYLFNAPGVGGILGTVADSLASVLGLGSVSTGNLWNVRSSEGISFIAGLGYQLGTAISVQTEATDSHGISTLVDALAVQAAYAKLSSAITPTQLNELFDAYGSRADTTGAPIHKTLETALDALRFIALGPSASKTEIGGRDALYTNLNNTTFQNKLTELAGTTQFTLLTDKSGGVILGMAKGTGAEGLAARYALVAANPFVLTGANYDAFSGNGALERFDPAAGTGKITDEYLGDRANFMVRELWFNTQDKNPYNPGAGEPVPGRSIFENESRYFEDATTGYKIQQGGLFHNTPRYYFGDNQANNPAASRVADHFYGGGGDDTLAGGEGDDHLEGGTGNDTYTVNAGDGIDTIFDADGSGVIKFGALTVAGNSGVEGKDWVKLGNAWVDSQSGIEYVLEDQGNGSNDLLVRANDGQGIRIKAWSEGKLGVTLGENTPFVVPIYDQTITETELDRNDVLEGGTGNDLTQSLGGNDSVNGKEGNDRIEGGIGEDNLGGAVGNDIVLGGTGSDLMAGQEDDDRLYAESEYTLDEAYTLGVSQAGSGQRATWGSAGWRSRQRYRHR